ncbi:MAG: porin [Rhodoferax sp.]|nr:porin [Rhodoferax sp.]
MKKSLVALAVLAASGASFAQSSVTVYGIADVWFGSVKNENNQASVDAGVGAGSISQTVLESGGVNGSRWGLKGSEDLGGGLKANFKLEQGFKMDTGVAGTTTNIAGADVAGQAFSREAYVGFSGGFGEVKLGKVWTAYDDVSGASNAVFDSALAPMNNVFESIGYLGNPGNTVYYSTPTMSGFGAAVSYTLGENKTATTNASDIISLNVSYGAGPLNAHLGYQVEDVGNATDTKFTRLGASYDFGVATAKATYGKVANVGGMSGEDATDYQIGVDVPVSPALTLSASYAQSDDSKVGFEQKRKGYGIAAAYSLSKRTFLYGGYEADTATNEAAADSKHSVFAVGVQHRF